MLPVFKEVLCSIAESRGIEKPYSTGHFLIKTSQSRISLRQINDQAKCHVATRILEITSLLRTTKNQLRNLRKKLFLKKYVEALGKYVLCWEAHWTLLAPAPNKLC